MIGCTVPWRRTERASHVYRTSLRSASRPHQVLHGRRCRGRASWEDGGGYPTRCCDPHHSGKVSHRKSARTTRRGSP